MLKPGCVPALVYFRYPNGHLVPAPFTDCPTPEGSIREEADTLPEIDRVVEKICQQEREKAEREMAMEEAQFAPVRAAIKDRMCQHMISKETDQWNKDFYRYYFELKDEKKKEKYRQRFMERSWYLHAREYDLGNRSADKEEVNLDKVNF